MKDPLLRPADLQTLLGVSRATAYALVATGEIPCIRIGRSVRIAPTDLESFIQRSRSTVAVGSAR